MSKTDNSVLSEPVRIIRAHAGKPEGSNWTDAELVSQITVLDRKDPQLTTMIALLRNRLCRRAVEAWDGVQAQADQETRHQQELRDAFKAGWRTNADIWQDAAYLDGCEQVDYEDFQKLKLAAYLDTLTDIGETMDTA